jgi:hypothetical protein
LWSDWRGGGSSTSPLSGLVDGKAPAFEKLAIEALDRAFSVAAVPEFDESKASDLAGLAINWNRDKRKRADLGKMLSYLRLGRIIGKIPDEKTDGHITSSY